VNDEERQGLGQGRQGGRRLVGAAIKPRLLRVQGQENRNTAALTAQVRRPWGSPSVAAHSAIATAAKPLIFFYAAQAHGLLQ